MTQTDYPVGQWIGWNGGECPVHPETVVRLIPVDGSKSSIMLAKFANWEFGGAFRIVTPYVEPAPKLECWANVYPNGGISTHETKDKADMFAWGDRIRCVYMVEASQ